MDTSQLIQKLKQDAKPVKRLPAPFVRFSQWFLTTLFCLAAGLVLLGLRSDLSHAFEHPLYVLEAILLFLGGVTAAFSAFILSVPGGPERSRWIRILPLIFIALWLVAFSIRGIQILSANPAGNLDPGLGLTCIRDIIFLALLPSALLAVMIRQAHPLRAQWTGGLLVLAVSLFGAFGTHLSCSINDPLHVFVWHFLPVIAFGLSGTLLGRKFLDRNPQSV